MNESSPPDNSSEAARRRLAEACRSKDKSRRLAWTVTISEAFLLGVLGFALADYWLMLPVAVRSAGAGLIALLVVVGTWRLAKCYRRPTPLKEAALDLEAQRPELGCQISTAAEYLAGERRATEAYEPELVAALEAHAARELESSQKISYDRRLVRPSLILFLTLLGLLVFIGTAPVAWTALTRTVLPFSHAHYTQLQVTPGSVELPVGADLIITNRFTGRPPPNARIQWQRPGAAQWESAALSEPAAAGVYLHSFKNLQSDLRYRVSGGDAASPEFEVRTYVPPEVKALQLRIQSPSYTGRAPSEQRSGDVTALRASQVQVRVEPSVPLSQARIHFSKIAQDLLLQADQDGAWTGVFQVTQDTDYTIELADTHGHRGIESKPHHLRALPDAPPKVEVIDPGRDTHAAATNRLPVKISVTDDYGVAEIRLAFHKLGGSEQAIIARQQSNDRGNILATAELDLSKLDLKPFQVVAYRAEATDNNTLDGPGVGRSRVYFVEITDLKSTNSPPQGSPTPTANLLALQKQIIGDTAGVATSAAPAKFDELAGRQQEAHEFGNTYLQNLKDRAPAAALSEMKAAVDNMASAGERLKSHQRDEALPVEESALAHLYQVIQQLPDLQNLPTQPPPPNQSLSPTNRLAVVLEAIREKAGSPTNNAASLAQVLQQAQALAQAQAALNAALTAAQNAAGQGTNTQPSSPGLQKSASGNPASAASRQTNGAAANPELASQKQQQEGKGEPAPAGGKDPASTSLAQSNPQQSSEAQGQSQGQGEGQGHGQPPGQGQQARANGPGQGQAQAEAGMQSPPQPTPPEEMTPEQLGEQERLLSEQTAQLAEQLQQLERTSQRLNHQAGQQARAGGQKLATATEEIKKGNFGAAGVNGYQGELALRQVAAALQKVAQERPTLGDVANEEAPKAYEGLISEYFKKLSHAE